MTVRLKPDTTYSCAHEGPGDRALFLSTPEWSLRHIHA